MPRIKNKRIFLFGIFFNHIVQDVPGKGKGVVATRRLVMGTLIMEEEPVIVIDIEDPMVERADILRQFKKLSEEKKKQFLDLFDDQFEKNSNATSFMWPAPEDQEARIWL